MALLAHKQQALVHGHLGYTVSFSCDTKRCEHGCQLNHPNPPFQVVTRVMSTVSTAGVTHHQTSAPSSESVAFTAAGVLPYSISEGRLLFLLGKEERRTANGGTTYVWQDFGGAREGGETEAETAAREFAEETFGLFFDCAMSEHSMCESAKVMKSCLEDQKGVFVGRNGSYTMFVAPVKFVGSFLLNVACEQRRASGGEREKVDFSWVSADALLGALNRNQSMQQRCRKEAAAAAAVDAASKFESLGTQEEPAVTYPRGKHFASVVLDGGESASGGRLKGTLKTGHNKHPQRRAVLFYKFVISCFCVSLHKVARQIMTGQLQAEIPRLAKRQKKWHLQP